MESFIKDYDKIIKRQRTLETHDPLDRLIAVVNEAKEKIREDPSSVTTSLAALGKSIKTVSNGISEEQKEIQSSLTKYSKAIDKKFTADMMAAINPHAFDKKENILRNTIAMHFIRQGNFEIGDTFAKEAGLTVPDSMRHQFMEMFDIVAALKEDNLEPALQWATRHRSGLEKRSSTLEFKLHRQRYLQLLMGRQVQEAIAYARKNFAYFGNRHTQEIFRLMCSIIYMDHIRTSPYADLIAPNTNADIQHMFTRDFCSLIGLSCDSPLYVSVTVGTQVMPTMIKMASIMKTKKAEWSQLQELPPVEINLTDETKFHSIFACPVSKEQATEENPPMMMGCGHVICKESLQKLCRGSSNLRFKCPYCPQESMASQAKSVYF
ncbi:MAG: CTLH/CRA C-terminal to lish motif domain-containing protein [Linnemannia gamsii]|nr:MAG: CTLH/CRA C-terminal to lish motif domain-containing protein [Linnemannia gamsii]